MSAWNFFENGGLRAAEIWHRRAGKDLFAINLIATKMAERNGLYWHVLPTYNQGRKIVWDGFTRDGRRFLDYFPEELITGSNSTDMKLTVDIGGKESVYQVVGSDDADRLVGTNPIGVVFSEYSLQDPDAWDFIRPILAENGGWALFIYTARGRNHGWDMMKMAMGNPKWHCEVLKAGDEGTKRPDGTPVISDEIIDQEREAGMSEEKIQQEFYCSFEAPITGAYWGNHMMRMAKDNRITRVPYESRLPVDTYWDLGMDDSTAITFVQQHMWEIRIIDYYENSGEGIEHYAKILREKDYNYGDHGGPHDIEVRELGTGKSRRQTAKQYGIKFRVVPKTDLMDSIENVRGILSKVYMDEEKCHRLIEAMRGYRKEWNEKMKCWGTHPLHDWTSHGASTIRYMARMIKDRRKRSRGRRKPDRADESGYDPLG